MKMLTECNEGSPRKGEPLPFDKTEIERICNVLEKVAMGKVTTPNKMKYYLRLFTLSLMVDDGLITKEEMKIHLGKVY